MSLRYFKFINKHKKLLLVSLVIIFIYLFSRFSGFIEYYSEGNLYYYSNRSFLNGIDITRGYGNLRNVNPLLTKILFNKIFFPAVFIIKYLTIIFEGLSKILFY